MALRRRGVGVGRIQAKKQAEKKFEDAGKQMESTKAEHVKESLGQFKASLEDFAMKYKDDIRRDPLFRQQFQVIFIPIFSVFMFITIV